MSASTYQLLLAARKRAASQSLFLDWKAASIGTGTRWCSFFTSSGRSAGAAPTTAAVPSRTIAGAFGQTNANGDLYYAGGRISNSNSASTGTFGAYMILDRLSHQGGLSGTAAGAQTTNLPTAALTRYTDGVGVMAFVEIYSAIGTTATTATVSYTNQAGTGGQTSEAFNIGASTFREATVMLPIPLAAGDYGVRSVESLTLAGTTGTAGNFGITLARPLVILPYGGGNTDDIDMIVGGARMTEKILDDACLFVAGISTTTVIGYTAQLDLVDV